MGDDGLKIQDVLDLSGMNLHELSLQTKIKYQTLLRYRDDVNKSVKTKHVRLICQVTGCDPNTLFGIGKPGKLKK